VAALIVIVFLKLNIVFFVPALMVAVGSMGMISPNTQACYLHYFGNNSGTAAALMGAIQLTIAGCMSALSTFIADGSLHPLVLTMGLCTIVCVFSVWSAYFLIRPNAN
jgi:DHA1 family bicyclomycin/chloramphenicol resistance-like MFS transporter